MVADSRGVRLFVWRLLFFEESNLYGGTSGGVRHANVLPVEGVRGFPVREFAYCEEAFWAELSLWA